MRQSPEVGFPCCTMTGKTTERTQITQTGLNTAAHFVVHKEFHQGLCGPAANILKPDDQHSYRVDH